MATDLHGRLLAASKRTLTPSVSALFREAADAIPAPPSAQQAVDLLVAGGHITQYLAEKTMRVLSRCTAHEAASSVGGSQGEKS